jgi:hypothetical protein
MYFACMTMTTVGYGDITPTNPIEYLACILLMVFHMFKTASLFQVECSPIVWIPSPQSLPMLKWKRELTKKKLI